MFFLNLNDALENTFLLSALFMLSICLHFVYFSYNYASVVLRPNKHLYFLWYTGCQTRYWYSKGSHQAAKHFIDIGLGQLDHWMTAECKNKHVRGENSV